MDTLIAAQRGASVISVDFCPEMLGRARQAVTQAGLSSQVTLLHCAANQLPLLDSSIDTAIVNGIFNLNPHREDLFLELARVIRPGGSVFAAEIILKELLPDEIMQQPQNWFA
jgi:ubiquinone/menaquinone biosynthesis C-methylase UbiE